MVELTKNQIDTLASSCNKLSLLVQAINFPNPIYTDHLSLSPSQEQTYMHNPFSLSDSLSRLICLSYCFQFSDFFVSGPISISNEIKTPKTTNSFLASHSCAHHIYLSIQIKQMSIIILPTILLLVILSSSHSILSGCDSCSMHQYITQLDHNKLEQRNKRFWHFSEQSSSWVEMQLPYDLTSCVDGDCAIVSSIQEGEAKKDSREKKKRRRRDGDVDDDEGEEEEERSSHGVLPLRRRISLTKMSETSVWVTGQSGSIYERFWNGLQWVIAPHDLPLSAGYAVSVLMVNHTILALSEAAFLYQVRLFFCFFLFFL